MLFHFSVRHQQASVETLAFCGIAESVISI